MALVTSENYRVKYYQMTGDEIEMTLDNLTSIDSYNHQLMGLIMLNHPKNQIRVPYRVRMDQDYLKQEEKEMISLWFHKLKQ